MQNLTAITIFSNQYILLNSSCTPAESIKKQMLFKEPYEAFRTMKSFLDSSETYLNRRKTFLWLLSQALEHKALNFGVIMQGSGPVAASLKQQRGNTTVNITHCLLRLQRCFSVLIHRWLLQQIQD